MPFSDKSYSGTNVLIKGVDSLKYSSVPLHNVYLSPNLVSGPVVLGIKPSLPFEGIHLLLGNDLAGDKVVGGPLLTNKPCCDQTPDPIEQEIPGLYPSCAVTRAMSKKQTIEEDVDADVDLSNTFLGKVFESDRFDDTNEYNSSKKNLSKESFLNQGQPVSKSSLIVEQKRDPEISPLFQKAVDDKDISAEDEWAVKYQVVIPKIYCSQVLSLAHETPMSGHLGVKTTYAKVSSHFY